MNNNHSTEKPTKKATEVKKAKPTMIPGDEKEINTEPEVKIVQTDVGAKDGQTKCPKCGSTDISTNISSGKLRCNFCRHEFEPQKVEGLVSDLKELKGQVMASGTQNIQADVKDVVTLKCSSCGAEVVVDTASAPQARCHWCRNTLSINQQIPNGSIPDVVLAFAVKKEDARAKIEQFVGKRKFFAHPKFKKEFTTENIMGVYFPYMIVDANAHANLIGEGEHETRHYTVKIGDHEETRYDADVYHVEREFDITIEGLSIESSSERLDVTSKAKTNNIINSIMPFDVENCVKYDANYIKGYTSEKRDTNVEQLQSLVQEQSKDIARFAANESLSLYDRGVRWDQEDFTLKGQQWKSAYLPVWLYSYQQKKKNKSVLHYVAVNARTQETMGSVPIHMPKLLIFSFIVEIISAFGTYYIEIDGDWLLLTSGLIFYLIMYARYRNKGARHTYETETKKEVSNMRSVDDFLKSEKGLSSAWMRGANNTSLKGTTNISKLEKFTKQNFSELNPVADAMKNDILK